MLAEQKIDFVQVEAGMEARNKNHVPFELLKNYIESHGYFLFGIYDQEYLRPTNETFNRYTNPVFISYRMVEMNRR